MEITALSIEGVGRFVNAEILGFGPNVNVLAAGNEVGKSTIFRAVRAVLFKRHGANDQDVRILETDGSKLPVTISLSFSHEGSNFEIRKSFLRNAKSSLSKDGKEIARDRTADEMLWEILGIAPGGGKSVDDAAFGVLWVGQRSSFELPVPSGNAAMMINALIEAEVGALVGGERAREVLRRMDDQISTQLTAGGKVQSNSPLGEVTRLRDGLIDQVSAVQARLITLDSQFQALETLRAERAIASDPSVLATGTEELKIAQESLSLGEGAARNLASLQQSEKHALTLLQTAERHLEDHNSLTAEIVAARAREAILIGEIQDLDLRYKFAQDELDVTRKAAAEINLQTREIALEMTLLDEIEKRVKGETELKVISNRLDVLKHTSVRFLALQARLTTLKVTQSDLTTLEKIEREIDLLEARVDAGATHYRLEILDSGTDQISLNDIPIQSLAEGAIIEPLRFRVGDKAVLTLSPPENFGVSEIARQDKLRSSFTEALNACGVKTLDEARGQFAQRLDVERQIAAIEAELQVLGEARDSLGETINDLQRMITAAHLSAELHSEQTKDEPLPSSIEFETRRSTAQSRRNANDLERQRLEGLSSAQTETLQTIITRRGPKEGELAAIRTTLASKLVQLPDDTCADTRLSLEEHLQIARSAYKSETEKRTAEQLSTPDHEEIIRRRLRVERLEQAQRNQHTRLGDLERQISNLEGHIQAAGGDGIGEELASLEQLAAMAARDADRIEQRLRVAQLLRTAVKDALDEGRERYQAPIHKHLHPYLNDLFPGATIELGEGFEVIGLKRAGPSSEAIGRLSDGTQEQIAVLVRLAMGALLAERGQIVPIILDDALVYSDDERIQRMFDSLTRAGTRQQVIVLTCRTRAFSTLGGTTLSIAH